jgi:hypothetical protein
MSNTSVSCIAVWQLFGSLKDDADSAVSSFPTDHPKLLLFVLMFTSMISQGFQVTTSQGLFAHELEYLNSPPWALAPISALALITGWGSLG